MVLSNAERQARFQKRLRERAALSQIGITPADIDRAVQMFYEACRHDDPSLPPFAEWLADVERRAAGKAGSMWQEMVPESGDPEYYHDHLSEEDRLFLAKVGAVVTASRLPAKHRKARS